MNEFTKEELQGLLKLMETFDFFSKSQARAYVKLHSMIDNYCEHTWFFHFSPKGTALRCHKCDKEING